VHIQVIFNANGPCTVYVANKVLSPARSQKLWNHSPDGFQIGYSGSGPAQLALALLLEAGLENERALDLHQAFKRDWIATLPRHDVTLDINVAEWVAIHDNQALGDDEVLI
jgi:hypothetical protein